MSDFKVRVKYHEIEVEIAIPIKEREYIEHKSYSGLTAIEMVKECAKQIETLIIAGRRDVA